MSYCSRYYNEKAQISGPVEVYTEKGGSRMKVLPLKWFYDGDEELVQDRIQEASILADRASS